MKNVLKNVGLLSLVLVLSYFTAEWFGSWYDKFSPQIDDSWFSLSKGALTSIVGFPLAYIFFAIFIFQIFGFGNKKKLVIWLLIPALLFFGAGDLEHIYLPIILGLVAFTLAKLIKFLISKFRHHNLPMVIEK